MCLGVSVGSAVEPMEEEGKRSSGDACKHALHSSLWPHRSKSHQVQEEGNHDVGGLHKDRITRNSIL